jgi:SAM-dependent methyltransferase
MRVLDCGCGVGSITVGLAAPSRPARRWGSISSRRRVARAQTLAGERGVANVRFEVASVYDLPLSDAAFDAAFANTLLLHLADPLRALREMRRVLKPGGVVAIADDDHSTLIFEPRTPHMTAMYQLIMRVVAHHGGDAYRARHYRGLLLEAGFDRPVAGGTHGTFGAWGTPEDTKLIAAWMADQVHAPAFRALVMAQGWADAAALDAMSADILAWGERPDALMAIAGVAALGWATGPV